ncbi:hypothetical protein B0H15DRAFT_1020037 [Mycena belliarum]|uniref:Uncharacterized protein n=1 Tax=Mycena belliarum TaxID=1033014 RepID=A0AAD6XRW4_9AGAR|nr:hypothetical protein B0H15DRAFT_1020037 [Mycena belliae]
MAPYRTQQLSRAGPPYSRATPLLRVATPKMTNYLAARQSNNDYNILGVPTTWCPFAVDWVPWMRPMRLLKGQKRLVPVAASGFHKVPNLRPPRCPHTFPSPRQHYHQMTLHLNKVYDEMGSKGNFYRADSHSCSYYVLIPDLDEHKSDYITTQEEKDVFDNMYTISDDGDEAAGVSLSQQSGASSSTTTSMSSEVELEQYLLNGDPRMPRPTDTPPSLGGTFRSFFNERVANARQAVNYTLISDILSSEKNGWYARYPQYHPLAEKPTASIMQTYDRQTNPSCLTRAFSNLEHVDTHLGRAIREFNSPIGIPLTTWSGILSSNASCSCCRCEFSLDGYNSHVVEGRCSMAPPMDKVPIKDPIRVHLPARTYPAGFNVPLVSDFMDTPGGIAFSEWNSRIGVPVDIWTLLSTGGVECATCRLRRSFDGHTAHLGDTGDCQDPGIADGTIAN